MATLTTTPAALVLRRLKAVRRNEDGATAIEFAIVSMPFLALMFGIISISLVFFWIFTMENAVWAASRDMRTGAFQTQSSSAYQDGSGTKLTGDALKIAFRNAICSRTVMPSDCNANTRILVQASTTFASITAPNCLKVDNSLIDEASAWAVFDAGSANSVVMVTACYEWAFGGKLPFFKIGNTASGGYLIQASSAFRVEPYN